MVKFNEVVVVVNADNTLSNIPIHFDGLSFFDTTEVTGGLAADAYGSDGSLNVDEFLDTVESNSKISSEVTANEISTPTTSTPSTASEANTEPSVRSDHQIDSPVQPNQMETSSMDDAKDLAIATAGSSMTPVATTTALVMVGATAAAGFIYTAVNNDRNDNRMDDVNSSVAQLTTKASSMSRADMMSTAQVTASESSRAVSKQAAFVWVPEKQIILQQMALQATQSAASSVAVGGTVLSTAAVVPIATGLAFSIKAAIAVAVVASVCAGGIAGTAFATRTNVATPPTTIPKVAGNSSIAYDFVANPSSNQKTDSGHADSSVGLLSFENYLFLTDAPTEGPATAAPTVMPTTTPTSNVLVSTTATPTLSDDGVIVTNVPTPQAPGQSRSTMMPFTDGSFLSSSPISESVSGSATPTDLLIVTPEFTTAGPTSNSPIFTATPASSATNEIRQDVLPATLSPSADTHQPMGSTATTLPTISVAVGSVENPTATPSIIETAVAGTSSTPSSVISPGSTPYTESPSVVSSNIIVSATTTSAPTKGMTTQLPSQVMAQTSLPEPATSAPIANIVTVPPFPNNLIVATPTSLPVEVLTTATPAFSSANLVSAPMTDPTTKFEPSANPATEPSGGSETTPSTPPTSSLGFTTKTVSPTTLNRTPISTTMAPSIPSTAAALPTVLTSTAAPSASEPTSLNPTKSSLTTTSPSAGEPTQAMPKGTMPTTLEPSTSKTLTAEPSRTNVATSSPSTAIPASSSIPTAMPTKSVPTSLSPTTSVPTTPTASAPSPSTAAPSSYAPTAVPTSVPTTLIPTAVSSNTAAPSSYIPTEGPTAVPTTLIPTTVPLNTATPSSYLPTEGPTSVPSTFIPTALPPSSAAPSSSTPTAMPTTSNPTTLSPTTSLPTTLSPTTIAPTLILPASAAPTTSAPTTMSPSTALLTTSQPTAAPSTSAPTPSPTWKPPRITGFFLVNAVNGTSLFQLTDGATVDLAQTGNDLTIVAETEDSSVVSRMSFVLNSGNLQLQTSQPFSLGGYSSLGAYNAVPNLALVGPKSLFASAQGHGGTSSDLAINFHVMKSTNAPSATPTTSPIFVPRTATPSIAEAKSLVPSTITPSAMPTAKPSTAIPTVTPSAIPTEKPSTAIPTVTPTAIPTEKPSTAIPTQQPTTAIPTAKPTSTPTQSPTWKPPKIVGVSLVNTENTTVASGNKLFSLTNGTIVDLVATGSKLTVVAVTEDSSVITKVMFYLGTALVQTEENAPYCIAGNSLTNYRSYEDLAVVGTKALTIIATGKGGAQDTITLVFNVVNSTASIRPTSTPTATPTTLIPTTITPTQSPTNSPTTMPTRLPTAIPTTISPSSATPTTMVPTSASPTTATPSASPTTTPTTETPTTIVPTSASPTTMTPTTYTPTTITPTPAPTSIPTSLPTPAPTNEGPKITSLVLWDVLGSRAISTITNGGIIKLTTLPLTLITLAVLIDDNSIVQKVTMDLDNGFITSVLTRAPYTMLSSTSSFFSSRASLFGTHSLSATAQANNGGLSDTVNITFQFIW